MKKILFFAVLSIVAAFVALNFYNVPIRLIPYPYVIQDNTQPPHRAENSTILVVGDRLAHSLDIFTQQIKEQVFKSKNTPFKIFNWAKDNEGLHRTISKLKKLKKLPSLVIYFGGSQEYFEQKFSLDDHDIILGNFKKYENPYIQTALLIAPWISKFIYKNEDLKYLSSTIKGQDLDLNTQDSIYFNQLLFKIYESELAELFQLSIDKKFKLLVIIPPINLDVPIRNNCLSAPVKAEKATQIKIEELLRKNLFQQAYTEAVILNDQNKTSAYNHQLLGKSLKGLGKTPEAIAQLEQATVYDCDFWRGNLVMNSILKKQIKSYGVSNIDFHQYLLKFYNKNLLFFDPVFPQRIFYNRFISRLTKKIQVILEI